MKTFVIGATGQIGTEVSRVLADAGHEVTGFCRNDAGENALREAGHRVVRGQLDEDHLDEVLNAVGEADCTVFTPHLDHKHERAIVSRLIDRLSGSGKRFIYTSGTAVFGEQTWGKWSELSFAEDDEFIPFEITKHRVAVEQMVREAVARKVDGIVLRPSCVWGKGYHALAERMVGSYEKTGAVCYLGEGMNGWSMVHVEDLADLYLRVVDDGVPGAVYHAAHGEIPNRCIAELLAVRLGCKTRSIDRAEATSLWGEFATQFVFSISSRSRSPRSRGELGWAPSRTNVVDALLYDPLRVG